jgi:transposase-like protein
LLVTPLPLAGLRKSDQKAEKRKAVIMAASQQAVELKHKYNTIPIEKMRREYFEEGLSCKQIGKRHGKSRAWATKWLTRFGCQLRPKGNPKGPLNEDQQYPISTDELVQLCVVQELSAPAASKHLAAINHPASGITRTTINRRLWKAGYRLPRGNRRCKVSLEAMIANYIEKQLPLSEVARIAGVSLNTARNRLRELGIKLRRRTDGTQITLARKRAQRDADYRELQQFRLSTKPKQRGKPKGSVSPDTHARVTIIAACRVKGITPYQIAPHAYPLHRRQGDAWKALEKFLERHSTSIAQRELELASLSKSEYRTAVEVAETALRS